MGIDDLVKLGKLLEPDAAITENPNHMVNLSVAISMRRMADALDELLIAVQSASQPPTMVVVPK